MNDHRQSPPAQAHGWTCDQVRNELESWALGALDQDEMQDIERHLADCGNCRSEADRLLSAAALLPYSLDPVSPSDAVRLALMHRIADDQAAMSQPSARTVRAAAESPPKQRTLPHVTWSQALVAPLAIALTVMTLWAFQLNQQVIDDEDTTGPSGDGSTAMLPQGAQTFAMTSECDDCVSSGRLVADPDSSEALFVGWNLDASQKPELWCEEEDGVKLLVANLDISTDGDVVQTLEFARPVASYAHIYVTRSMNGTNEAMMGVRQDQINEPSTPVHSQ